MQTVPASRIITDAILLFLVWLPIPILYKYPYPVQRGFFCNDVSIRLPEKSGFIPASALYSVGCLLPTITIVLIEAYRIFILEPRVFRSSERVKPQYQLLGKPVSPYLATLYIYLGYFYFGMALNVFITDLGKYSIGRLRPNFIDICKPDLSVLNCHEVNPYQYIDNVTCNNPDERKVRAARLSFPSGHQSFSAYTMIYLVLYLQARMIWPMGGLLTKHVLQFTALVLTIWTGFTRVADHKHHWSDVLAGFILGAVVATVTAYAIVGMFRRPQSIFAQRKPYDSRSYSGGQLFGDYVEEARWSDKDLIATKEIALA